MIYEFYSKDRLLTDEDISEFIENIFLNLGSCKNTIIVPPDISRLSSGGGMITGKIYRMEKINIKMIIPALGTHTPMTGQEITSMFGNIPQDLFIKHSWKGNLKTAGTIPESFIYDKTGVKGISIPVKINHELMKKGVGRIVSIGQVVPHEVTGMSNHNKNILIGTGGDDIINYSHYLSAIYGMERIMGKGDNPVRDILNYAESNFLSDLPVLYIMTVTGKDSSGEYGIKGIFAGDDRECYKRASAAAFNENITILGKGMQKIVIFLPENIKSLWIGNKAIYRSRMAVENGGELIIIGRGIKSFGEDKTLDKLIRKYGYRGMENTVKAVQENKDLRDNLSAAAHLIHGSSENRFRVSWKDTSLSKEEIESAGHSCIEKGSFYDRIDPENLKPGYNSADGEDFYYIPNPGQGLWSTSDRFTESA